MNVVAMGQSTCRVVKSLGRSTIFWWEYEYASVFETEIVGGLVFFFQ